MATRKRTARSHRHGPNKTVKSSADAKRRAVKAIREAKRATRVAREQGAVASRAGKRAIVEAKRATKQAKRRAMGASRSGKRAIARAKALVKETERSTRRLKHGRSRNLPKGIIRKPPKQKPKQRVAKRIGKKLFDALLRKTGRATKKKLFIAKRHRRPAKTPRSKKRTVATTRRHSHARMRFFSDGRIHRAAVTRRTAKEIGRYMGAVSQFLPTGDIELLAPFEDHTVTDVTGKRYRLETRPNALYELNAEPEGFEEIYELVS